MVTRTARILATPEKVLYGNPSPRFGKDSRGGKVLQKRFSPLDARLRVLDRDILETRVKLDYLIGERERLTAGLIG